MGRLFFVIVFIIVFSFLLYGVLFLLVLCDLGAITYCHGEVFLLPEFPDIFAD